MRGCAENKNQVCTMNGFQVMGAKTTTPKKCIFFICGPISEILFALEVF